MQYGPTVAQIRKLALLLKAKHFSKFAKLRKHLAFWIYENKPILLSQISWRSTSFKKCWRAFHQPQLSVQKQPCSADKKLNCDETAVTMIQNPPKVIVQWSLKQIGQITSTKQGTLLIHQHFKKIWCLYHLYMLNNTLAGLAHPSK